MSSCCLEPDVRLRHLTFATLSSFPLSLSCLSKYMECVTPTAKTESSQPWIKTVMFRAVREILSALVSASTDSFHKIQLTTLIVIAIIIFVITIITMGLLIIIVFSMICNRIARRSERIVMIMLKIVRISSPINSCFSLPP